MDQRCRNTSLGCQDEARHDRVDGARRLHRSGVVYMIVGGFAVLAAFGSGGATTGTRGALYSF